MIFKDAFVFLDTEFQKVDVEVEGDTIVDIGEKQNGSDNDCIMLEGKRLLPGFIDLHTHGRSGYDFSTATAIDIGKLCISYAEQGVTSL